LHLSALVQGLLVFVGGWLEVEHDFVKVPVRA